MQPSNCCIAAVFSCLLVAAAHAAEPPAWMSGCWTGQDGTAAHGAFEAWTTPRAGQMLGVSQTVRDSAGATRRNFEFMRIEASDIGIKFIPQPDGKAPVTFDAVVSEPSRHVFHSPANDFPKYIEYARDGDTLTARLSNVAPGVEGRRLAIVFKRTNCDSVFAKP